uniref:Uncharacterized protein n=1 Tax=Haptolina ericina TaxID=156174 RepID=A0A7S3EYE2_9EUKA|mmetsp:Transcript_32561/g.73558  ORF Transcript_32561/g.73558 Transcript_32561/m.73558 type:complete len:240 (+) Transcript_32561:2-721(+)
MSRPLQTLVVLLLFCVRVAPFTLLSSRLHGTSALRRPPAPTAAMAGFGAPPKPKKPAFNLKTAMEAHMRTHSKLAAATPKNQHADVYVRATGSEKFFFVGKALAAEGVCDAHSAVVLQKRIILEHGKLLQRELKAAAELELWTAPRNTELIVAEKRQRLYPMVEVRVSKEVREEAMQGPKVGFEPEQYESGQKGFYVRLQDDGTPGESSELKPRYVSADMLADELEKEGKEVVRLKPDA